jgi:hypothetical protein
MFNMYKSFHPQQQCPFFAAPIEIRDAIYAHLIPDRIHISLNKTDIRLSRYVQRDEDGDADCHSREDINFVRACRGKGPLYIRRLRSEWGPHWRCEETAIQMEEGCKMNNDSTTMALFLVCKRM